MCAKRPLEGRTQELYGRRAGHSRQPQPGTAELRGGDGGADGGTAQSPVGQPQRGAVAWLWFPDDQEWYSAQVATLPYYSRCVSPDTSCFFCTFPSRCQQCQNCVCTGSHTVSNRCAGSMTDSAG